MHSWLQKSLKIAVVYVAVVYMGDFTATYLHEFFYHYLIRC